MPDDHHGVWQGVLSHLRTDHPDVCRRWFDELDPLGFEGGAFGLRAHSDLHRDYLRRHCLDALNDAVLTVTGQLIPVRLIGPDERWETSARHKAAAPRGGGAGGRAGGGAPPAARKPVAPARADVTQPAPAPGLGAGSDADSGAGSGLDPAPRATHAVAPAASHPPTRGQAARPPVPHAASERERLGGPDALPINPDYAFENFVQGPNSRLAHAAALAVADNPGHAYNPLFIHGGVGLGKTHLLQAVCLRLLDAHPSMRMHYVSCDGFMTQFMSAVQSGRKDEFRHAFRDVDLLVIDDIHFLAKRDVTQEEFFHTFNALYQANKQIVLSSDAPPDEIPDLEDRLVSRFTCGLVCKVEKPGYETRVEILKRKAGMRGLPLPDDVAAEIAHHIDTNIRELEGAITRLRIVASVEKRAIDLALARETLAEYLPRARGMAPTIDQIIHEVITYYQIKRTDVLGKRKLRSVTLPRQVGMFIARETTGHSLEEIGAHFGGRDHTTVMHAVQRIALARDTTPDIERALVAITTRLRAR